MESNGLLGLVCSAEDAARYPIVLDAATKLSIEAG
jgi:hypothetical protein